MRTRILVLTALAFGLASMLSGCEVLGWVAPNTYQPAEELAAELDFDSLGEATFESRYGTGGLNGPVTLEMVIAEDGDAFAELTERLADAGFEPGPDPTEADPWQSWRRVAGDEYQVVTLGHVDAGDEVPLNESGAVAETFIQVIEDDSIVVDVVIGPA